MVYIAPMPRSNQQKLQPAVPGAGRAAGKGKQQEPHQQQLQLPLPDRCAQQTAGRSQQRRAQQQPAGKPKPRPDVVRSKQDLLQELNRQAELNTLVLQREQAALQALRESQSCGLPAQPSVGPRFGSAGPGAPQDMGPPAGLKPLTVQAAKNHRFYDVSPKAFNAAQVPGLSASPQAAAQGSSAAGWGWPAGLHQQQQHSQHAAAVAGAGAAFSAGGPVQLGHARQQQQQIQQQRPGARVPGPAANRAAAGAAVANNKQAVQQQGPNGVQRQRQRVAANRQPAAAAKAEAANKLNAAKGAMAAAAAAVAAAEAEADDASQAAYDNDTGQLSPFADADWRFEWGGPGSPNAAYAAAQQQSLMNQTFPDSPQFKTGRVFEIPEDGGMGIPAVRGAGAGAEFVGQKQLAYAGSPAQHAAAMAAQGNPWGGPVAAGGMAQGSMPLAPLQLLQRQQQQHAQEVGWLGTGGEGASGPHSMQHMEQQVPPQELLQSCRTLADVSDALQAVQGYADPAVRAHLVKELKQKQYKLELEQQIAEREATRRAAKAAATAYEAAEDAARAAAPPPWNPAARAGRWGGGGEPLRSIDGTAVTDLRAMKSRVFAPGVETSQTFPSSQQAQQLPLPAAMNSGHPQQQLQQFGLAGSPPAAAAAGAARGMTASQADSSEAAAAAAGGKGFMSGLHQLKAGPSEQQRAAAAAARQQLLDDLQAQVAEKAARAAAGAAADAARTAAEEAALQRYYVGQQQQKQQQQHSSPQPGPDVQPQPPSGWGPTAATGSSGRVGVSSSGAAMLQAIAAEASDRAAQAGVAAGGSSAASDTTASPAAVRKGRSKKVIEAPWLDQLQQRPAQQQQQQQQLQQQRSLSNPAFDSEVIGQPEQLQQQQLGASSSKVYVAAPVQQHLTADAAAAAALGEQPSSQHLAEALQELQQGQQLMWQEFIRQARALEQLLADKKVPPSDSRQAWDELQRMRGVMGQAQEQQQALQQMYATQQNQPPHQQQQRHSPPQQQQGSRVGGRGRRGAAQQQQQRQPQPELSRLSQQHSMLCVSTQPLAQQQQGCSDELLGDALDAFMVETQMVPVTVNSIPDSAEVGSSLMQMILPPSVLPAGSSRLGPPVQHYNRYGGAGLDAELSACSVASAGPQARGGLASSSSAVWGGSHQQQQALQRPPASPPILRGDRFVEEKPERQLAGSNTARAAGQQQQQQASPSRRAGAANAHAGRAAARGGKASAVGGASSAGKASNVKRRI